MFTFIVLSYDCTLLSFAIISIFTFFVPLDILLISILALKPDLSPFGYPGYALFTSTLVPPSFASDIYLPSIDTFTCFMPVECNAHPPICNILPAAVSPSFGKSKLLLGSKFGFSTSFSFNVIFLVILCTDPSLAIISIVNTFLPLDIFDISYVFSNPLFIELKYSGYSLLTSALNIPTSGSSNFSPSNKTFTSLIPNACNAQPLINKLFPSIT